MTKSHCSHQCIISWTSRASKHTKRPIKTWNDVALGVVRLGGQRMLHQMSMSDVEPTKTMPDSG